MSDRLEARGAGLGPSLPTNRLREVAPQVRAACEAHGVDYRQESWPRTIARAFARIAKLSRKLPHERNLATPTPAPAGSR